MRAQGVVRFDGFAGDLCASSDGVCYFPDAAQVRFLIADGFTLLLDQVCHHAFGNEESIVGFPAQFFESAGGFCECIGIFCGELFFSNVAQVFRVGKAVVEFNWRTMGGKVVSLSPVHAHAAEFETVKLAPDFAEIGKGGRLVPSIVRIEVANVEPATVTDGARAVEDFIDTITGAVNPLASGGFADDAMLRHGGGRSDAGEIENGGGEVDEGYEAVGLCSGFGVCQVLPFFGNTDHEWDLHS